MNYRPIVVDDSLQELTMHGNDSFLMSMDEQHVAVKQHGNVMHWHYELQIALVTQGSVIFKTQDSEYIVRENEGIFFNSGCLHEAVSPNDEDNIYVCVNFHPKLIYGYPDSKVRYAHVDPLLFSKNLQAIYFSSEAWHKEICGDMKTLIDIDKVSVFGYELHIYSIIMHMCYLIVANNEKLLNSSNTLTYTDKQRIKTITTFIHQNYMDDISLSDIAKSDNISKGECCRIFKRVLNTTPFSYLVNIRLRRSVKLLTTTDKTIAEIAHTVGFGSGSYYTACFKKTMHCPPIVYRKQIRNHYDEVAKAVPQD